MVWQLRRASVDDLDAIMAIETTTFQNDAWSRDSMRREMTSEHAFYLVAVEPETPERVDAYAGLFVPIGAPQADVQTIAVAARARRSGLGRQLMRTLMGEARARGAAEMFLEVRADNPGAQALYASLGFEQIGLRPGYYHADGMDALVMRARLDPARTTTTSTGESS